MAFAEVNPSAVLWDIVDVANAFVNAKFFGCCFLCPGRSTSAEQKMTGGKGSSPK